MDLISSFNLFYKFSVENQRGTLLYFFHSSTESINCKVDVRTYVYDGNFYLASNDVILSSCLVVFLGLLANGDKGALGQVSTKTEVSSRYTRSIKERRRSA
jgi:hypothetical protein